MGEYIALSLQSIILSGYRWLLLSLVFGCRTVQMNRAGPNIFHAVLLLGPFSGVVVSGGSLHLRAHPIFWSKYNCVCLMDWEKAVCFTCCGPSWVGSSSYANCQVPQLFVVELLCIPSMMHSSYHFYSTLCSSKRVLYLHFGTRGFPSVVACVVHFVCIHLFIQIFFAEAFVHKGLALSVCFWTCIDHSSWVKGMESIL